jgi:hypothetical protein
MTNYQLGKIYKIVCNTTGLTYYGSTCEPTLARRLAGHLSNYKCWKTGSRKSTLTSYKILENEDYEIVLVEIAPSNSKMELHRRERYYIENNECVNKVTPALTKKETYEKYIQVEANMIFRKEQSKKYLEKNKDKITENRAIYQSIHKDEINRKNRISYIHNKEKYAGTRAEWLLQNKDRISKLSKVKHICECGSCYTHGNRSLHFKTKVHTEFIDYELLKLNV